MAAPTGSDIHPPLPSVSIGDRIADVLGSAASQFVEDVKTVPSYLSAVGEAVTPHIKGAASQFVEDVRNTPAYLSAVGSSLYGEPTTRSGVVEGWDDPPPTIVSDEFQAQRAELRNLPPQDDIYGLPNVVSERENQARSALTMGTDLRTNVLHGEPWGDRVGESILSRQEYGGQLAGRVQPDQVEDIPGVVSTQGTYLYPDTSYDWANFGIDRYKDSTPEALLAQELDISLYPDGTYDPTALNKATAGEEAYRLFREQRQLDQIAAKRQAIQDQVVRDSIAPGETTLSADWDRLVTAEDIDTVAETPEMGTWTTAHDLRSMAKRKSEAGIELTGDVEAEWDKILAEQPTDETEVIAEPTNPALDFWMERGDQTLQEAADALEARQVGDEESLRADVDNGFDEALNAWKSLRTPDQTVEAAAGEVILISLEGDTSEAAETVKKQAEKAVKSFKGTDIRDRVAEETITTELGPPDFYDKRFHVPTAVQDLAAEVVTGPSEEPPYWTKEQYPRSAFEGSERQIANRDYWQNVLAERGLREEAERQQLRIEQGFTAPLTGAGEYPEIHDPRFDMFGQGDDRGMVDPNQAYPGSVRLGVQGPVTPGDPAEVPYWANEFPPDALPFPDQNTWKEGYFPPDTNIEEEDTRGAYPAQTQDPTAAPVFPTQVGKDADPILPQDYPPFGEGKFPDMPSEVVSTFNIEDWISPEGELPGAGDFLGRDRIQEEMLPEDEVPVADEEVTPTGPVDIQEPPPEDVPIEDGPITPEMIEQGPWQKTQMGFFAKDYRPSDLELGPEGQPITRPAGFFGEPVPPAPVTPPAWLNPDDEAALEADVAKDEGDPAVREAVRVSDEVLDKSDISKREETEAVIEDADIDADVEVEDERVSTGVRDAERETALTEARDAILYLLQELERDEDSKGNIINVVGQDLYNKIESANYTGDDIEEFYKKLLKHKDRIKRIDEETGTYYWNTIENIYRILVLGELG